METAKGDQSIRPLPPIPWFGSRKMAQLLAAKLQEVRAQRDEVRKQLETLGVLPVLQLETRRVELEHEIAAQEERLAREMSEAAATLTSRIFGSVAYSNSRPAQTRPLAYPAAT
jgi:hypothetical protein